MSQLSEADIERRKAAARERIEARKAEEERIRTHGPDDDTLRRQAIRDAGVRGIPASRFEAFVEARIEELRAAHFRKVEAADAWKKKRAAEKQAAQEQLDADLDERLGKARRKAEWLMQHPDRTEADFEAAWANLRPHLEADDRERRIREKQDAMRGVRL